MGLFTATIGAALRGLLARRIAYLSDVQARQRDTARVQFAQLRRLLQRASFTQFGKEHDFARLAALPDEQLVAAYRHEVPACDYEGFRKHVARMREGGEPDVLWPGLIRHFAQTSGTTAGDKYIPVSREMLASNRKAALDIFANAARFGASLPRLFTGKILFLGGSTDLSVSEHGIATGDLSGLVTPMIRWPVSSLYLPGQSIALMSDWPAKIDAMARVCIDQDVRVISGMPSWMLVLFERTLELARQRGGRATTIREIWPSFELLIHGGVKYAPFDPRVRQLYSGSPTGDDLPTRLELYPASEGFIAIQDTRGDPGLRLLADLGNFYEFIPLERVHDPDPPAFTADAVEKGQRYVVCMSTCAGLWRYIIGDVVEFDTIPADLDGRGGDGPARLRIVGRHRHFINAFGENLIVEHIENAVATAASQTGLVVGEFTAAPIYPASETQAADEPRSAGESADRPRFVTRAGLQLAIEVHDARTHLDLISRFGDAFDAALKSQNVDYTTKRTSSLGMVAPTITPLPPGSFHRWMQSRGKLGGQHKCPRCANHRELIESLLATALPRDQVQVVTRPASPAPR